MPDSEKAPEDESKLIPQNQPTLPANQFGIPIKDKKSSASASTTSRSASQNFSLAANIPVEWTVDDVILDRYRVKEVIAGGGMGLVYRIYHREWHIDLAVKRPRPDHFNSEQSKQNFIREAETWVKLGLHPHVVSCYYVRTLGGIPSVFAEFIAGGTLSNWIQSRRLYEGNNKKTLIRLLDIANQIAWGLDYAHEFEFEQEGIQRKGLVHQDVKPANIMMTPTGIARVTDFGLSQARAVMVDKDQAVVPGPTTVVPGVGAMTLQYASPEQVNGQSLTRQTDIWSWAVTLLEMFAGGVTWLAGVAADAVLSNYLQKGSQHEMIPLMPEGVVNLLRKCFQKDPNSRPATLSEVAETLQQIYGEVSQNDYPSKPSTSVALRANSLNNQALSFLELNRPVDAQKSWQDAHKIDELHLDTTYNYGLWQWRHGQQTDDLKFVQQMELAVAANKDSWRAHYLLAMAHRERGDMAAAQAALNEAWQLSPNQAGIEAALKEIAPNETGRHLRQFSYLNPVKDVIFSTDDQYGIWAGGGGYREDNSVLVWELATGKLKHKLSGHEYPVNQVCVTSDNRKIVTQDDFKMRVWSWDTGECLQILNNSSVPYIYPGTTVLTTTPDGQFALSLSHHRNTNSIRIWYLESGQSVRTLPEEQSNSRLYTFALSEDGQYIVGGYVDGQVDVWETATGQKVESIQGSANVVSCLAIAHDNQFFMRGSQDGILSYGQFSPVKQAKNEYAVAAHEGAIRKIIISGDDRHALLLCSSFAIQLWDIVNGKKIHTFEMHKPYITGLEMMPDGKYAVSASTDRTVRVLDLVNGRCIHTFVLTEDIHAMALSSDGSKVLAAETERDFLVKPGYPPYKMHLWDLTGIGDSVAPWEISQPVTAERLSGLTLTAETELDAASSAVEAGDVPRAIAALRKVRALPGFEHDPGWLTLWRQVSELSGQKIGLLHDRHIRTIQHSEESVRRVACTQNGRYAIAGGFGGNLRVWDLHSGKMIHELAIYEGERKKGGNVTGIALTQDEEQILVIRGYGSLEIWDWINNHLLSQFPLPGSGHFEVILSPDGKQIVITSISREELTVSTLLFENNQHKISSSSVLKSAKPSREEDSYFRSAAISPNGQYVLASTNNTNEIVIWDIDTAQCLDVLPAVGGTINCIAFSPDGQHFVTGHDDYQLRYWQLYPQLNLIKTLSGHGGFVESIAVTPDGRYAVSGSRDATVRIWNLMTGDTLRILSGHLETINDVVVTSNGFRIVSGSADGMLNVWDLDWDLGDNAPADWHEDARPYLRNFLALHTPRGSVSPSQASNEKLGPAMSTQQGIPTWTEQDFRRLLSVLRDAGFGWLRPRGVRHELESMRAEWQESDRSLESYVGTGKFAGPLIPTTTADTIKGAMDRHLARATEAYSDDPRLTESASQWQQLLEPDILQATILHIGEGISLAQADKQHHWYQQKYGDLIVINSVIPYAEPEIARSFFLGDYLSFLDARVSEAKGVLGQHKIAHWVWCGDEETYGLHLTFLPKSGHLISMFAQDLLTREERKALGLPDQEYNFPNQEIGILFWFDWTVISNAGHPLYGRYIFEHFLPKLAEESLTSLKKFIIFDGDYLPRESVRIRMLEEETADFDAFYSKGLDKCYVIAVYGDSSSLESVHMHLAQSNMIGYLGKTTCVLMDIDAVVDFTEAISLIFTAILQGPALQKNDFAFVSDVALQGMGLQPVDLRSPPN